MRDPVRPDDLPTAANLCRDTLLPWADRDWTVPAGDLTWSCRRTLDHIINVQLFLAANAAMRSTSRVPPPRNDDPAADVPTLLETVVATATMQERICAGMDSHERGFHPAGQADAEGMRAQCTVEILQHTFDIAAGLGEAFEPPQDLCDRLVARLFPWAPEAAECPNRWLALLWCVGRIALPDHPRLESDWWIQAAPLDEWDGTRRVRTMPPAWR